MKNITATLMIPVYNSFSVLKETLETVEKQTYPLTKIFLIDDFSQDSSLSIINKYKKKSKFRVTIVKHNKNRGLSYTYNEIIKKTDSQLLITLNPDCLLTENRAIEKLITPFSHDQTVVESCSYMTLPFEIWKKFSFWQKCLFARHVGRKMSGRNSTFCCFKVSSLIEVGLFDEKTFRTGGEDADILARLQKIGQIVDVDTTIIHVHSKEKNFGLGELIHKENQRAETVGASLSKNFELQFINLFRIFLRPLLLFGLFHSQSRTLSIYLILLFSFFYTQKVYLFSWKNRRIIILPLVNIFLLFSYCYYFSRAFFLRKQQL